jgi:exopolyphosphatase/guanosine-5'-triphosphate,3'-diphosphate pyrophosphatase
VRLGSGLDASESISNEAIERALSTLLRFKKIADSMNAPVRAVATSAVREAQNQEEFIERIRAEIGLSVDVISGQEEARLIYLGILQALPVYDKRILAIDIGGGSTEFVIGLNGTPLYAASLKLGAIRLNDKFFHTEPITAEAIEGCRKFVRIGMSGLLLETRDLPYETVVGSSGTIETLMQILLFANPSVPPKESLTREDLDRIVRMLLKEDTAKKREKIPGLDAKRADIIIAGAILLQEIMSAFNFREMLISPYALREGIIYDTLHRQRRFELEPIDIRRQSVIHLAEHFHNPSYSGSGPSLHTAALAVKIFDALLGAGVLNGLDESDREILEYAAILHNIGLCISHSSHHKHGAYIIRNTEHLIGFTHAETEMMALLTRYHRKSLPQKKHPEFDSLSEPFQTRLLRLASILRIATALDRTGQNLVQDLRLEHGQDRIIFHLNPVKRAGVDREPTLEIWAAEAKADLFEKTFGKRAIFSNG